MNTNKGEIMKEEKSQTKKMRSRMLAKFREFNRKRKERLESIEFGLPFTQSHILHPLGPRD